MRIRHHRLRVCADHIEQLIRREATTANVDLSEEQHLEVVAYLSYCLYLSAKDGGLVTAGDLLEMSLGMPNGWARPGVKENAINTAMCLGEFLFSLDGDIAGQMH